MILYVLVLLSVSSQIVDCNIMKLNEPVWKEPEDSLLLSKAVDNADDLEPQPVKDQVEENYHMSADDRKWTLPEMEVSRKPVVNENAIAMELKKSEDAKKIQEEMKKDLELTEEKKYLQSVTNGSKAKYKNQSKIDEIILGKPTTNLTNGYTNVLTDEPGEEQFLENLQTMLLEKEISRKYNQTKNDILSNAKAPNLIEQAIGNVATFSEKPLVEAKGNLEKALKPYPLDELKNKEIFKDDYKKIVDKASKPNLVSPSLNKDVFSSNSKDAYVSQIDSQLQKELKEEMQKEVNRYPWQVAHELITDLKLNSSGLEHNKTQYREDSYHKPSYLATPTGKENEIRKATDVVNNVLDSLVKKPQQADSKLMKELKELYTSIPTQEKVTQQINFQGQDQLVDSKNGAQYITVFDRGQPVSGEFQEIIDKSHLSHSDEILHTLNSVISKDSKGAKDVYLPVQKKYPDRRYLLKEEKTGYIDRTQPKWDHKSHEIEARLNLIPVDSHESNHRYTTSRSYPPMSSKYGKKQSGAMEAYLVENPAYRYNEMRGGADLTKPEVVFQIDTISQPVEPDEQQALLSNFDVVARAALGMTDSVNHVLEDKMSTFLDVDTPESQQRVINWNIENQGKQTIIVL